MKGVLVVAHGSRRRETTETFSAVCGKVREKLPGILLEGAYMEFHEDHIHHGLDRLLLKGATDIVVVPYFLFDGIHIHQDIPEEIEKYKEAHQDISLRITMGKTLGADDRLAEILTEHIEAAL